MRVVKAEGSPRLLKSKARSKTQDWGTWTPLQARSPSRGQPALQAPRLGLCCRQFLRYVSTPHDELPPDGVAHGSRGLTEAEPGGLELLGWVAGGGGLGVAPRPRGCTSLPRVASPRGSWLPPEHVVRGTPREQAGGARHPRSRPPARPALEGEESQPQLPRGVGYRHLPPPTVVGHCSSLQCRSVSRPGAAPTLEEGRRFARCPSELVASQ